VQVPGDAEVGVGLTATSLIAVKPWGLAGARRKKNPLQSSAAGDQAGRWRI